MSVKVIEILNFGGFYKFRQDQLNIVRRACNVEDIDMIRQSIEGLRDWMRKQDYFNKKDNTDYYFEKLLVVSKGSLERSKTRLDKICTLRTIWPIHFEICEVSSFLEDFKTYKCIHLRDVTGEGSRVCLSKLYNNKTLTTDVLTRFIKYAVVLCEYAIAHDYPNGFEVIIDFRDVNLIDLLAFGTRHFTLLQQLMIILMDGYGMRLRGLHVVTTSKATDTLVTFVKQLLPKKLASRLHVHRDMNILYDYVSSEILPLELGGDGPSINDLHEDFIKELFSEEHKMWMVEANCATVDESKKPKDYFSDDYISISGSFRTLSVD